MTKNKKRGISVRSQGSEELGTKNKQEQYTTTAMPDICSRIMFAVWELTKDKLLDFVTREEIAEEIERQHGKSIGTDYIRNNISDLQAPKIPYDTFLEDKNSGNMSTIYRLNEDTVLFPETAWILISICQKGRNHRIPPEAIAETKKEAVKYGLSAEEVDSRIEEALRVGYIKKTIKSSYLVCKRLLFERQYLLKVAATLSESPPISSQHPPKRPLKKEQKKRDTSFTP